LAWTKFVHSVHLSAPRLSKVISDGSNFTHTVSKSIFYTESKNT